MSNYSRGITADYVESFLYKSFPNPNQILEEVDEFGQRNNVPIIGPLVGRFLHLFVRACKPSSILEIGTAIGYSTIWLASALPDSSKLTTIEIDEETIEIAKKNIVEAKLSAKVRFLLGDAGELIPQMKEKYDFVFLDTEKNLYPKLLPYLIKMVNIGGFLVADNTLWRGRVATNDKRNDTLAVKDFDYRLIEDRRLFTVIVPIGTECLSASS
jgi:predicted O-methyltransferase YrrM